MNLFSTNDRKTDLKIRIDRSRYNLLFIVLMSVVNIFLITSGNEMLLPYSSSISNYSVALGISESLKSGSDSLRILGLIVACAVLLIIMICYVLSKTKHFYLIISLSIIVADTIVLAVLESVNGTITSPFTILDIVIHGLAIFYIVSGIIAAKEFRKIPVEEGKSQESTLQNNYFEEDTLNYEEELDEDEEIEEIEEVEEVEEEDLSKPIGKYVDDGTEPLVQGEFDGLKVFAIIRKNKAELVINNFVCDELDVNYMTEFQLRAFVNDIDFTFDFKETESVKIMYLYADNELIDSLGIC